MMESRYEEQFKEFLMQRIENMIKDENTPWVKVVDEPILNVYGKPYQGLDLLMITQYCRENQVKERIFCTYQQRKELKQPVRRNEKCVLVEGAKRDYPIFSCHINNEYWKRKIEVQQEARKELKAKAIEWIKSKNINVQNEKELGTALYQDVFNRLHGTSEIKSFIAEITAASIAAQMGVTKNLENVNIKRIEEFKKTIPYLSMTFLMNEVKKEKMMTEQNIIHTQLNSKLFQKNIETALKNLEDKQHQPKKMKVEDVNIPRIKR